MKMIQDFHSKYYRAENLTIILIGQISPAEVFQSIQSIEKRIENYDYSKFIEFNRPWKRSSNIPKLEKSINKYIAFPSDDEECGSVTIAWRGPTIITENLKIYTIKILLRYLTETPVSPLYREFIENKDPYAGSILFNLKENLETLIALIFQNVPIEKIEMISIKFMEILKNLRESKTELIDMQRIYNLIDKETINILNELENNSIEIVTNLIKLDSIYGNSIEDVSLI